MSVFEAASPLTKTADADATLVTAKAALLQYMSGGANVMSPGLIVSKGLIDAIEAALSAFAAHTHGPEDVWYSGADDGIYTNASEAVDPFSIPYEQVDGTTVFDGSSSGTSVGSTMQESMLSALVTKVNATR